jgi:hypothetical protein
MSQMRPTLAYRLRLGVNELPPYRYDEARHLSVDANGVPAAAFPKAGLETYAERDPGEPGTNTRAERDPGDAQYLGAEALVGTVGWETQERPEPPTTATKAAVDPGDPQTTDLAAWPDRLATKNRPSPAGTGASTPWSDDLVTGIVAF